MPIVNYSKPQSFVQQYLQVLTDAIAASRNAFIYGPQYRLSRYTNATELQAKKDDGVDSIAPTASGTLTTTIGADETIDHDFTKVYGEDLEVELGTLGTIGGAGTEGFKLVSTAEPHKIKYITDIGGADATTTIPQVAGRDIQVGDTVEVAMSGALGAPVTRTVTAIEDADSVTDSVLVLDGAATLRYITESPWTDEAANVTVVYLYNGLIADTEYATDLTNGVTFSALPDVVVPDAEADTYTVRSGVGTLYLSYRALVKPSVNESVRKITSSADIETYFGDIDPDNWLAWGCSRALSGSAGKEIYATRIASDDATGYADVLKKASQNINLYAHCPLTYDINIQQLVAAHVEAMSQWDIKRWRRAYVATDVLDSYVILEDDEGVDFEAAIDTDGLLTTTTGDSDFVTNGVTADDVIRVPRVEISTVTTVADDTGDLDATFFTMYDDAGSVGVWFDVDAGGGTDPSGAARGIKVDIATDDSANTVATKVAAAITADSKFHAVASDNVVTITDANIGTRVDIADGGAPTGFTFKVTQDGTATIAAGYTEYVVAKVLGPVTLTLDTAPLSNITGVEFQVWAGNTGTKQATYAANRSEQLGTRRVINVWCDSGTRVNSESSTEVVENIFLAAEIAGLRSVALPHQGLTRTEVTSISAAPLMYTKYTEDDLNIAAASGVFIVTQDLEDGPCYIRHQLTTKTDKGSLYYEDSVGVNIDDISFNIVSIIDGYIGKYNATPDTVQEIQNKINELLHNKARADRTQFFIGPQLLDYDPSDLTVELDSTFRDQINVSATLTVPLPLNKIIVELFAGVSFNN